MKAISTTSTTDGLKVAQPGLDLPRLRRPGCRRGFAHRRPRAALQQNDRGRGDHEPDRPGGQDRASPELNHPDGDGAKAGLDDAESQRDGARRAQAGAQAMGEVVAARR